MSSLRVLWRVTAGLTCVLALAGCATSLALHPDSPVPKRWASDPRTRGWGALHIVYSSWEPGERVKATIISPSLHRQFTASGLWRWEAPTEVVAHTPAAKLVQVYEFDGVAERYRTVYVTSKRYPAGEVFLCLIPSSR